MWSQMVIIVREWDAKMRWKTWASQQNMFLMLMWAYFTLDHRNSCDEHKTSGAVTDETLITIVSALYIVQDLF